MGFEEREMSFEEADRRYAELKRRHEARDINNEQFDEQLKELMVRDDEERWWARSRKTGEWHYSDGDGWKPGTPPGYRSDTPSKTPRVKAIDLSADMLRTCAGHKMRRYYVGEAIPRGQIANARKCFPIPSTERVLALLDTSLTGNGKLGLAVCESGVYWRNPALWDLGTKSTRLSLTWKEFSSAIVKYVSSNLLGSGNYIEIGEDGALTFIGGQFVDERYLRAIVRMLQGVQSLARTSATLRPVGPTLKDSMSEEVDGER